MNDPKDHWDNMPEFSQERQKPFAMINVRFETEADLIEFQEKTGLKLTAKTKSAWYPERPLMDTGMKRWK